MLVKKGILYIALGIIGLTAIITNWSVNWKAEYNFFQRLADFFSYFTIQTNIASAIYLIVKGIRSISSRNSNFSVTKTPAGVVINSTLLASNFIMLIVYWTMLFPLGFNPAPLALASNITLHAVMPISFWLVFGFERQTLKTSWWLLLQILVYPMAYAIYSWIRGAIIGWYPYFFLNPQKVGGTGGVILWFFILLAAFVVAGLIIKLIHNKRFSTPS